MVQVFADNLLVDACSPPKDEGFLKLLPAFLLDLPFLWRILERCVPAALDGRGPLGVPFLARLAPRLFFVF